MYYPSGGGWEVGEPVHGGCSHPATFFFQRDGSTCDWDRCDSIRRQACTLTQASIRSPPAWRTGSVGYHSLEALRGEWCVSRPCLSAVAAPPQQTDDVVSSSGLFSTCFCVPWPCICPAEKRPDLFLCVPVRSSLLSPLLALAASPSLTRHLSTAFVVVRSGIRKASWFSIISFPSRPTSTRAKARTRKNSRTTRSAKGASTARLLTAHLSPTPLIHAPRRTVRPKNRRPPRRANLPPNPTALAATSITAVHPPPPPGTVSPPLLATHATRTRIR